jgi:hypothetical protein
MLRFQRKHLPERISATKSTIFTCSTILRLCPCPHSFPRKPSCLRQYIHVHVIAYFPRYRYQKKFHFYYVGSWSGCSIGEGEGHIPNPFHPLTPDPRHALTASESSWVLTRPPPLSKPVKWQVEIIWTRETYCTTASLCHPTSSPPPRPALVAG